MARASGTSATTIGTSPVTIFDEATDGGKCTTFTVRCRSASSNPVAVNIPQLHGDAYLLILAGGQESFRAGSGIQSPGIAKVLAKGIGGNASVDYFVSAVGV
jgi:hypothetical protein